MTRFRIENRYSGFAIEYDAEDEQGALDAMARDAGYRDYAHISEAADDVRYTIQEGDVIDPEDLRVVRVDV